MPESASPSNGAASSEAAQRPLPRTAAPTCPPCTIGHARCCQLRAPLTSAQLLHLRHAAAPLVLLMST